MWKILELKSRAHCSFNAGILWESLCESHRCGEGRQLPRSRSRCETANVNMNAKVAKRQAFIVAIMQTVCMKKAYDSNHASSECLVTFVMTAVRSKVVC